jgi:hypothetical protein
MPDTTIILMFLGAIQVLLVGIIIPLWREVRNLKERDLARVEKAACAVREKLDKHIAYHLTLDKNK